MDLLAKVGGNCIEKVKESAQAVVKGVMATGKEGTVTITLRFKKNGKDQVSVGAKIVSKVPEEATADNTFYVDSDSGMMTERDPKQLSLLDELDNQKAEKEKTESSGN